MLNSDSLSQLAQLKQDIQDSKDYGTGRVVGSKGRFGFVKLEDGRDAYLSADQMQHLIPGDIITVSVRENAKSKLEADLEKLVTPGIERFVGQYRIKGKAHFIQPGGAQSSRWLFVPPKGRSKNTKDGDYVIAKLTAHPFKDTKASAKVLDVIGREEDANFERTYVVAKYNIDPKLTDAAQKQAQAIAATFEEGAFGDRNDLTQLNFVTIDSVTTKDMDDALHLEALQGDTEGVRLRVAIADPSHFVDNNSALAKRAQSQGTSNYLLGGSIPMLPTELSNACFSLVANQKRPALVCQIDINASGEILNQQFEFATIESKHKLSYQQVADYLDNGENAGELSEDILTMLTRLSQLSETLATVRKEKAIVPTDHSDYEYSLDEQGHITDITQQIRNKAHRIVEEAMVLTNTCAAKFLSEHSLGLYSSHPGFREERLGEVKALLKEEEVAHEDIQTFDGYLALMKFLENSEGKQHLLAPLRRMLAPSELSTEPAPHLGMGLPHYTTVTSPIRRYTDLYNHWAISHILQSTPKVVLNEVERQSLNEKLSDARQADRELSQWLTTLFTESKVGSTATGKIRIVTQQGFGVKLDENGIEGFVLFAKDKEKSFDAKRMTLTVDEQCYAIGNSVEVKIEGVDKEKRRVSMSLV